MAPSLVDDPLIAGYQCLDAAVRAEGGRMLALLAHPGPTETEGPVEADSIVCGDALRPRHALQATQDARQFTDILTRTTHKERVSHD